MSSYHSAFTYLGKDSQKDFGLLVAHFEADQGETESFLTQEQVYTPSYNGSKRLLYGTKWTSVATVKITVIKQNRSDFTVADCRAIYKWLTGNPVASWLDLYAGGSLKYSFSVTVQDVKPEKLDARTVGLHIYFESLYCWAFSPEQKLLTSFGQALELTDGVLFKSGQDLTVSNAGVLNNGAGAAFKVSDDGVIYIDNSTVFPINNESDDLYSYVSLNTKITNINSEDLIIKNETLYEMSGGTDGLTELQNILEGEVIELTPEQMIFSDAPSRIFGNSFNFIWPKLVPGINKLVVSGSGQGLIEFTYRYPIKIGDCAIDIYIDGGSDCACPDNTMYGTVAWEDIVNTPTTIGGYGITDAYTDKEVDAKITNVGIQINEKELNDMLSGVLAD